MKKIFDVVRRKILYGGDPRIHVLKKLPRDGVCAEIGVWKGEFSSSILSVTAPKELNLVDPWIFREEYPDRMYGGKIATNQKDMDEIFEGVRARFAEHPEVCIHRGASNEVLNRFEDGYFDWIYIDGNHYYEYVLEDLRVGYEKLKNGGFLVGDDYNWGAEEGFPVRRAADQFLDENKESASLRVYDSQYVIRKSE